MNDMAFRCEHVIADAGGLARTDLAELNRSLRRNINSARGYRPPIELAAKRLAGIWFSATSRRTPETSSGGRLVISHAVEPLDG